METWLMVVQEITVHYFIGLESKQQKSLFKSYCLFNFILDYQQINYQQTFLIFFAKLQDYDLMEKKYHFLKELTTVDWSLNLHPYLDLFVCYKDQLTYKCSIKLFYLYGRIYHL